MKYIIGCLLLVLSSSVFAYKFEDVSNNYTNSYVFVNNNDVEDLNGLIVQAVNHGYKINHIETVYDYYNNCCHFNTFVLFEKR